MKKCYPRAYEIHGIGELIGFVGLLALFCTIAWMALAGQSWWLLAVPFGIGIVSEVLVLGSWAMVRKRGFKYDWDKSEASWDQDGKRVVYNYVKEKKGKLGPR
jgi:hypothetical protein